MILALVLLVVLVFFTPYVALIPMPAIAAILLHVAYNMCDEDSKVTHLRELPESVRVYEINDPMFFGMTDRISDISVKEFTKYLIIRMRGVPSLEWPLLKKITARILAEVPGICRVCYDLTPKPIGMIEWE